VSPKQILTTVMTCIVVDKSTDHAKSHFDFFLPLNINVKENAFSRMRAEKGIARHVDTSSVV